MTAQEKNTIDYGRISREAICRGFTKTGKVSMDALIFRNEIRDMCSADKCGAYGKTWRCPPAIGSVEDSFNLVKSYRSGIIVETVGTLEDEFDIETMTSTMEKHGESFISLMKHIRAEYPDAIGMGAGTCKRCVKCTYPNSPCRFPHESFSSMEAYGLWVSDVCEKSGIPYNNGAGTITYISCILFKEFWNDGK